MLGNIVFDIGQVLLSYDPRKYLEQLYEDPEKRALLFRAVFGSPSWPDLDQGLIDEAEAFQRMAAAFPELSRDIRALLEHWDEMLVPVAGSIPLLQQMKERNYRLFVISNFHLRAYERVRSRYPFFDLFDGILISAHVKLLKPDRAIYSTLLREYSLPAETCVFIDDMPKNVAGAQSVGMTGLVFEDAAKLERDLQALGVL